MTAWTSSRSAPGTAAPQTTRSFVRFDASLIKGKVVTQATLQAYEYWSYSCSDGALWVDGAGTLNPGMNWNNQPSMDGQHWYNGSFAGRSDCAPSAPDGYKQMNITGLVQQWSSNGNTGPEHLALRAADEYDNNQWKKFYSVNTATPPFISVTYENPGLPGPPQNVQVAPGNGQATVTWGPPANLGQPPLSGYFLQTLIWNGSSWVQARTDTACASCPSKVVPGLTNGATYFTYVYAMSGGQYGGFSYTPASYVPGLPAPPPSATAAGRNQSATVSWTASPNNGGSPIQAYGVFAYHYPSYSYANSYTQACGSCLTATVAGLTNGQQYAFVVYAHNGAGWSSTGAGTNAVTPAITIPNAPTNVIAAPASASATVTWSAPTDNGGSPIDANFVFAYTHPALTFITYAQVCPTCTSATVTGLTNGHEARHTSSWRSPVTASETGRTPGRRNGPVLGSVSSAAK
ncbi:MAG: fibronectin type III domain-containing protein [Acidimicrobiales bacterium]